MFGPSQLFNEPLNLPSFRLRSGTLEHNTFPCSITHGRMETPGFVSLVRTQGPRLIANYERGAVRQ